MIVEIQKFNNKLVWLVILLLNGFLLFETIQQVFFNIPFGNHPAPNTLLIIILLISFGILLFFKSLYLKVEINSSEILVQLYPFTKRSIKLNDVKQLEIIKYNPLSDYGGWGIRYGKKGMAYTIGGNLGLSITLNNNQNILIGIRDEEKFKTLISKSKF